MSYYINAYHDIDKSFARPDGRIRRTISDMNSSRDYPDALKKDEQIKKLNKDILAVIDGGALTMHHKFKPSPTIYRDKHHAMYKTIAHYANKSYAREKMLIISIPDTNISFSKYFRIMDNESEYNKITDYDVITIVELLKFILGEDSVFKYF